ncbi:MAG: GreA/GreB family elongation factor [Kiritimatiellia bacterium]
MTTETRTEEWFLEALESEQPPASEMIAAVTDLYARGDTAHADEWVEMSLEALGRKDDAEGALRMTGLWLEQHAGEEGIRGKCREAVSKAFRSRLDTVFVKACGLKGNEVPVEESLGRLGVLKKLVPGAYCLDKTWGFGVVRNVDDFYGKITVDFEAKPGHAMSFAYAAETLELVDRNHILAFKHRDPDGMAGMTAENPERAVRLALESFGPMTAGELAELFTQKIFPEDKWKKFWEAARKKLKAEPDVDVPAKRSEPLRLIAPGSKYDEMWLGNFRKERDPGRIVELCSEFLKTGRGLDAGTDERRTLLERLSFAAQGAEKRDPATAARAVLLADEVSDGSAPQPDSVGTVARALLERGPLLEVLAGLPRKSLGKFLGRAGSSGDDVPALTLADILPEAPAGAVDLVVNFLDSSRGADLCDGMLGELALSRNAGPSILLWMCRDMPLASSRTGVPAAEIMAGVIEELEKERSGEQLKAQNSLRNLIARSDWLEAALGMMTPEERKLCMARVKSAALADVSWQRALMGRMVKSYPDLECVLSEISGAEEPEPRARLTSLRSYEARRRDLEKLINETIPQNSREIARARSYGDLRENFEYQAAKDMQRLLFRRQQELKELLEQVKATDFRDVSGDTTGRGTRVILRRPGGKEEEYSILGEWDSEPSLGIIPEGSEIGRALQGRKQGDRVGLPGDSGTEECEIVETGPLSGKVLAWARNAPERE